jgi:hypothetical protein
MSDFYVIPGGINWCKANLKIIIGNRDLAEIMQFGDLWRSRGHIPLVHVVSPAMDKGKMWDQHVDPSGLLDNIPAHIDMFIVDFLNKDTPEVPKMWDQMTSPPKWQLWEYAAGKVKFNGTYAQFIQRFELDPAASIPGTPTTPPTDGDVNNSIPTDGGIVHFICPHCKKLII